MKNFNLDDWNKLMAVRLISAFWSQKTIDSYFLDIVYVEFIKNFHLADSNEVMGVSDSFRPAEPEDVCFLLSWHDVRRVHEQFLSRRF